MLLIVFFPIIIFISQREKRNKEFQEFEQAVNERLKSQNAICEYCLPEWHNIWKKRKRSRALRTYARIHPREAVISDRKSLIATDHLMTHHPHISYKSSRSATILAKPTQPTTQKESESDTMFSWEDLLDISPSTMLLICALIILFLVAICRLLFYW